MLAHRRLGPVSPGRFSDGTRDESYDRGVCHTVSAANLRKVEWQHREHSGMFVTWRKQAPGCWPAGNCAPVPAIKLCFCVSSHDRGEMLASQCLQGCFQNPGQVDLQWAMQVQCWGNSFPRWKQFNSKQVWGIQVDPGWDKALLQGKTISYIFQQNFLASVWQFPPSSVSRWIFPWQG